MHRASPAARIRSSRASARAARRRAPDRVLLDGVHLVAEALDAGLPLRQRGVRPPAHWRARTSRDSPSASAPPASSVPSRRRSVMARDQSRPLAQPRRGARRTARARGRAYGDAARWSSSRSTCRIPGNLGAIVRVAEAGGATGVVAAGACADPFGWKALRGSMGSALRLPVARRAIDRRRRRRGPRAAAAGSSPPCRAAGVPLADVDFDDTDRDPARRRRRRPPARDRRGCRRARHDPDDAAGRVAERRRRRRARRLRGAAPARRRLNLNARP